MVAKTDHKRLLLIKKYLDNGYTQAQTADITGASTTVISKIQKEKYGELPTFKPDIILRKRLKQLNLKKMQDKLGKRKHPSP